MEETKKSSDTGTSRFAPIRVDLSLPTSPTPLRLAWLILLSCRLFTENVIGSTYLPEPQELRQTTTK